MDLPKPCSAKVKWSLKSDQKCKFQGKKDRARERERKQAQTPKPDSARHKETGPLPEKLCLRQVKQGAGIDNEEAKLYYNNKANQGFGNFWEPYPGTAHGEIPVSVRGAAAAAQRHSPGTASPRCAEGLGWSSLWISL